MSAIVGERGRLDGGRCGRWPRFGEETFDAAAEINEHTGDNRADALKDQEARPWIDVSMSLTLKSEAEGDKKHQGNRKIFQLVSHRVPRGREMSLLGVVTWVEDAVMEQKFRDDPRFFNISFFARTRGFQYRICAGVVLGDTEEKFSSKIGTAISMSRVVSSYDPAAGQVHLVPIDIAGDLLEVRARIHRMSQLR